MIDLQKHLNASQLEVATTIYGPVLVIAGAGSGKTRVIEYRVLNLVQNKIDPRSILLLTFTRRAAREMLARACGHDPRASHVEGGTFHSFAYKALKKYASLIGFKTISILDEGDAAEALAICCRKAGIDVKEKRFPRKDTLRAIISMSVNKHKTIGEVVEREYPAFLDYTGDIARIAEEFVRFKTDKGYLDYDDLLLYLAQLLKKHKELTRQLCEKYKFIMVDEYQDTNTLQADITYSLAEPHGNICAVGDDAQSIYGFRGASHENIMEFPKKFKDCKIVKLEANYRSSQSILDVANAVLTTMARKYSKHLFSARQEQGQKPQFLIFDNGYEEAEWVSEKILESRDRDIPLHHQAVLFRSAYISIPLQAELSKRNIPYQVFGGLKFYETAHVKDLLAHLKIINNYKDELAWNRSLSLIDGIGPKTAERLSQSILAGLSREEAFATLTRVSGKDSKFATPLARLRGALLEAYSKPDIAKQLESLLGYYEPLLKEKFDDWNIRLHDLEALTSVSSRYDVLGDFLADFAIEPPETALIRQHQPSHHDERPLTLSTIHSAKGLEWDSVFLIGLIDGVLPVSFALHDEDELEEEHRLFYVGITRAKKHLFLSSYQDVLGASGVSQFDRISRFIDESTVLSKLDKSWYVPAEDEIV